MKKYRVAMMLIGSLLLGACSQANEPTLPSTSIAEEQQPTADQEPTAVLPTHTAQLEPRITAIDPTITRLPELTETAVTGQPSASEIENPTAPPTAAPSEPTATLLPEPTATAIPCSGVLTSPNQEGPFYSPGSPERSSLIDEGIPGIPILIVGRVFDQDCNPIAGAKLDFWLADVNGEYDNIGYTLRGHLFADQNGNYTLEGIEPTPYTGRPPHIHAKVFAPDGRELLTTQMYFSGSEDSADVTTSPDLLAKYLGPDDNGQQRALFNFIVRNP